MLFLLIANQTYAQISGVIFRDFDLNGKRTLSNPIEIGAKDVTIRAYVGSNTTPLTATSAIDGTYQFSAAQIPAGSKVRLEFDNFGEYSDSFFGVDNKSTVQFVTAPQTGVNLGINYSDDYCDSTVPTLVLPCFVNGNPLGGGSAGEDPVLVAVPYGASGVPGDPSYPFQTGFALAKQIGAIWATAYQRATSTLFTAAFVKRHAGLGPLGIGGLYQTNIISGTTTNFVDLTTLGINFGTDPHTGIGPDKLKPSHDSLTMGAIGKVGIGGMALSHNQETLYIINSFDRKMYSVQIGVPAAVPTVASVKSFVIPNPGCPNNDYRPGAIEEYHGKIYMGVVCSGETSQDTTELKGTIYEFSDATGTFNQILQFPLNFKKGISDYTQSCIKNDSWRAWTSKFPEPCAVAGAYADGLRYFVMYPQPMITSLAFDDDGALLIGFTDRFGHQSGRGNWSPTKSDEKRYFDGFQGGDVLRAYNNNGTFVLENNGIAGPLTGCGVNSGAGPGGGQFYCDTKWKYFGNVAHDAIAGGGLTVLPGSGEVLATAYDPIDEIVQAGGLRAWNTRTGVRNRAFVLYRELPGSFGKAAGLGDIVVGCRNSPLEIGNRVWYDVNINGIQDPDEAGIDGVVLSLHDLENGGIEVAKDTTAESGQYYFNDKNVTGGLKFKHKYEIRMDIQQSSLKDNLYYKLSPRLATAGAKPALNNKNLKTTAAIGDTLRDSDGKQVGNNSIIQLTTGDVGETSHTYDVGLVKCVKPTAGNDLAICPPIFGTDFIDATTNQKWSFLSGPATATIDSLTGIIKNMTAAGDYLFVLTLTPAGATCSDTVKITRKIQPDAGIDQVGATGICSPISTAKLTGSPVGGTWLPLSTNVPTAQIDNNGNVTGMSKIGIYGFVYNLNGCMDTVKVEIKNCCQKPNAGQDLAYCMPNPTANLGTVLAGQKWEFLSGVAPAIIDSVSGKITGMTAAGTYQFLLYYKNRGKTCADTVQITLKQKPDAGIDLIGNSGFCSPISTTKLTGSPIGGTWSVLPTNSPSAQVDANGNVTGMTKIGIYGFIYTVNGCSDTVKVEVKNCCQKPAAGQDLTYCVPSPTADLVDALAGQKWELLLSPPLTNVVIDSTTGKIIGMTIAGNYQFLLYNKIGGKTCADTLQINLKSKPDAGIDQIGNSGFCSPISTTKLTGSPIGGTWSVLPTNSPSAQVDNLGNVTGMSKIGIYGFIYTVNGCADTVKIEVKDCGIGSIGDLVWYDKKKNGLQDNTAIGAYNICVELYKLDNLGNLSTLPLQTTKTDVFGKYLFKNLQSGDYKVKFITTCLPTNYLMDDKQAQGSDRNIDSDASPLTGFTDKITIDITNPLLQNRRDIDAGIVQTPTCPPCWSIIITTNKLNKSQ